MQPEPVVPAGLPDPDPAAVAHSRRVVSFIRECVESAGGALSFGQFMQYALYAPGLGYYAAGGKKFGAMGDFVTAPEVSPLFGRVLAKQCVPAIDAIAGASILELGAGSGALAVSLLGRLAELGVLPARYRILEVSAELADRQRRRLQREVPDLARLVEWVDALPRGLDGVVIANEVADALPVERFALRGGQVFQQYVVSGERALSYEWRPANDALAAAVRRIEDGLGRSWPDEFQSEVSLGLEGWIRDILDAVGSGIVLLFDYGLPGREYYAPERSGGWLRCHFRHRVHNEPLVYPGIQDITSWVDFSRIADAAVRSGARIDGFVTQAMFLMNGGLDNEFAEFESRSVAAQLELARQAKLLTLPTEMGENFKCLGLRKGDAPKPDAFAVGDRAHTL